jgi:D-glycero-alpha-D-manno-heptose-7-phosphate kinase
MCRLGSSVHLVRALNCRNMKIIEASAPTRVDLAGGTLDIWPLYLLVPKAVTVNAAISLRVHARLEPASGPVSARAEDIGKKWTAGDGRGDLPLHETILDYVGCTKDLTAITRSEVPAGSGLGGSSSLTVALLGALYDYLGRSSPDLLEMAQVARDIEGKVLRVPTGIQDHLAALRGGISAIEFGPGLPRVRTVSLDPDLLSSMFTVVYLGASRASATANWDMVRRAVDGEPSTLNALEAIAGIAGEMASCLDAGKMEAVGKLMADEWGQRRKLSPRVSTELTEAVVKTARETGAYGAKICGAGGGGCMLILSPPERRAAVAEKISGLGCQVLDCTVDLRGLVVGE